MAISIAKIEFILLKSGFSEMADQSKHKEFIHTRTSESVYLNKAEPKVYSHLIVHPRHLSERTQLINAGVGIGSSNDFLFGAGYRAFPERIRNGVKPCKYGVPFGFDSIVSLNAFLGHIFP